MKLVHTLLLFIRQANEVEDVQMLAKCLKTLEKSMYKTVVIYNQGYWNNQRTKTFVDSFGLNSIIIGNGENVGIVEGRQRCFEYIWDQFPQTEYISELHVDMMFTHNWEQPLIEYLQQNNEPVIGCGIVDKNGHLLYTGQNVGHIPESLAQTDEYLENLKQDLVVNGFTHPCIHCSDILKEIGGFDTRLLTGKQSFEDDSCLLGYFYYYGTKTNWRPKVCCKSVVYHATEKQRFGSGTDIWENLEGLVKQYGVMGLLQLSKMHENAWSKNFFRDEFEKRI